MQLSCNYTLRNGPLNQKESSSRTTRVWDRCIHTVLGGSLTNTGEQKTTTPARASRMRWLFVALMAFASLVAKAQERPYFVLYSSDMEEPGNLEIESKNAVGKPGDGNRFWGSSMEFEY